MDAWWNINTISWKIKIVLKSLKCNLRKEILLKKKYNCPILEGPDSKKDMG